MNIQATTQSAKRAWLRALPLVLSIGCTAIIDDTDPLAADDRGASGNGGPGSSGEGVISTEPFYGPIVSAPSATSRFVRLNHEQWENTVRDLLGLPAPLGLSSSFVAEPLRSAFDTNGSILAVPPDLRLDYQAAAETLAEKIARDPALLARVAPATSADAAVRASAFIENFGRRVYRRLLTPEEVTRYSTLFGQGPSLVESGDAFADGVEVVLAAMFQSPHFLYRIDLTSGAAGAKVVLSGYEIASRLSYGLTNTMPDDALFAAAGTGELQTREGVLKHAQRLLATPAAQEMVADFHDQLLLMREYEIVSKDVSKYPLFGEGVGEDMKQEALTFVHDVVFEQNAGLQQLLSAPYTFANGRIRRLYGLAPAAGGADAFARVELDPTQRAGLLTQVGFLAANGEQQTPNIIMRGVHIARRILCLDLPPPPDNVPPLPHLEPNSTNRQRVDALTENAPCSGCHTAIINPLGYALENLDGIGQYRTQENGLPIDSTGTYELDGKQMTFDGAVDLVKAISESYQAHQCYSRHWIEYLYGRAVSPQAEAELINQAARLSKTTASVKELILNLVSTEAFLTRLP